METIAYFSNIRSYIQTELKTAKDSIFVAVVWFTDSKLFDILFQKAIYGLDVQLRRMEDDITRNCPIDYEKLEVCGGKVFLISNEKYCCNKIHFWKVYRSRWKSIKGFKDERKKAKFKMYCKVEFGCNISEYELGDITF